MIRVLKSPKTERPFFGRVGDEGAFALAMVPRGEALTPYQPILTGRVVADEEGSRVELVMAPHPRARTFAGLFGLVAVLLVVVSLLRITAQPGVALIGVAFAAGFALFPRFRARHGFDQAAGQSLELLRANLPLHERV